MWFFNEREIKAPSMFIVERSFSIIKKRNQETYLVHRKNLSSRLLQLVNLVKEIPESRLGRHRVGSEHSHSVDFGIRIGLRRNLSSDNLEIFLLQTKRRVSIRDHMKERERES